MTDDELIELHKKAIRDAMDAANKRDGFASSGSRESIVAGLRLVAEAAWEEGARWAAVEFGRDAFVDESRVGLVPSDNPYRKEARP